MSYFKRFSSVSKMMERSSSFNIHQGSARNLCTSVTDYSGIPLTYVEKSKRIEELKQDCIKYDEYYQRGKFLMFRGTTVLANTAITQLFKGNQFIGTGNMDDYYKKYEPVWVNFTDVMRLFNNQEGKAQKLLNNSSAFVGIDSDETPLFALEVPMEQELSEDEILEKLGASFLRVDLASFFLKSSQHASIFGARSLLRWHRYNKYCTKCGEKLVQKAAGTRASCSSCKKTHYPKSDPAAITLVVEDASRKCLLVRQSRFPPGMYTAVAGYVDIGESVEETVHREVAEEVGLEVDHTEYVSSQHWALTGTMLMLGFIAHVKPGQTVSMDKKELEDTRWFSMEELRAALIYTNTRPILMFEIDRQNNELWVPPKPTLANKLITNWLDRHQ